MDIEALEERIDQACIGRTFAQGGLNMSHLHELAQHKGIVIPEGADRRTLQQVVCDWYPGNPVSLGAMAPCRGPEAFFPALTPAYIPEFQARVSDHIRGLIEANRAQYEQSPRFLREYYGALLKQARAAGDQDEVTRLKELRKEQNKLAVKSEHSQFAIYYDTLLRDLKKVDVMDRIVGMIKGGSFSGWFKPYYFYDSGMATARKLSGDRLRDLEGATRHFLHCVDAVHPEPLPEICVYRWQTMNDIHDITELDSDYMNLEIGQQVNFPFPLSTTWNLQWLLSSSFKKGSCCLLIIRVPAGQKYWTIPNDPQFEVALAAGHAEIIQRGTIEYQGEAINIVEVVYTSNLRPGSIGVPDPNPDMDRLLSILGRVSVVKWLDSKEAHDKGVTKKLVRRIKVALLDRLRDDTKGLGVAELMEFEQNIHAWARAIVTRHLE